MAFGRTGAREAESSKRALPEAFDDDFDQIQQGGDQTEQEDVVILDDMATSNSSNKKQKPLLDEVTMLTTPEQATKKCAGGSKKWKCNHCKKHFTSSYTRMYQHFFGAPVGNKAEITRCPVMTYNREKLEQLRKKVQAFEVAGVSPSLTKSTTKSYGSSTMTTNSIANAFGTMERTQLDVKLVRALCANGIPFNVLRNPDFVDTLKALTHAPKDYKPPSYDKARTTLLDECHRDVDRELGSVKDTWTTLGTSIVSDGWTNIKHQPLINVVASNSRGSMFMYAEDFSGVEKTGKAIAEFILKSIDEIGPSNVLQVVTDNATNCKLAGKEIEKVHNHIFWSPCVVHTLNLIFKDLGVVFPWMTDIYKRGKNIVKFFLNHQHVHAMFRAHSALELLKVAKTRFASHYILLKRLSDCREALATTIVLRGWKDWISSCRDEHIRGLGHDVAATIADEDFWDEVDNILLITKPIFLMIKFADGEGEKMGEVYEKMDCMIGEISDIMKVNKHSADAEKINEILVGRWEKMNIPMHCLGFALNPYYYDANYLRSLAPGGVERRAPNLDKEVVYGVLHALEKIGEDGSERRLLRDQLAKFQGKEGIFGSNAARADAVTMSPISWWSTYGAEIPELAEIARKVLSQPISSSSAERIWSTYSYIHNVKRNRLNATRADKLVFIHSNIRLISRFTDDYKKGPQRKWDIDPESAHLEDSTLRLIDLRSMDNEEGSTSKRRKLSEE